MSSPVSSVRTVFAHGRKQRTHTRLRWCLIALLILASGVFFTVERDLQQG